MLHWYHIGNKAPQITGNSIVYCTAYFSQQQWKHQCSTSLSLYQGIQQLPVDCPLVTSGFPTQRANNAESISMTWSSDKNPSYAVSFLPANGLAMQGAKAMKSTGMALTHWGRVTHICISKLTIIGSDNGLSPGRCQAIIWTNAGILIIGPLRTNFSEILFGVQTFSFRKMHLKMSSAL